MGLIIKLHWRANMTTKKEFSNKLKKIHKNLQEYSDDMYQQLHLTDLHLFAAYAASGVVVVAIKDLYHGDIKEQSKALGYFKSPSFILHCKEMAIDPKVMMYIVENPEKYADTIADYNQEDNDYEEFI